MMNGDNVKTNQGYFNKLGRTVYGTIENNIDQGNSAVTVVRVNNQDGNIIPEHQGNLVIMMLQDLEAILN